MTDKLIMIGHWQFDLSEWWLVAAATLIVLTLPLVLWACWRRLHVRSPGRAFLVMMLNVLAFTALFLLLMEPQREHLTSRNIILLSEGADLENTSIIAGDGVYVVPGALPAAQKDRWQAMANTNWLLDMGQLSIREPALSNVTLLGYGLDASQWQAIPDDITIDFTAPPLLGFSHMNWPHSLWMGQTISIQGNFTGPQADSIVELRLLDPAGKQINQRRIKNGGFFSLLFRPKSQGNILYRLQAWQNDTLLSDQPVTVSVGVATPMQIMVKQSAPSFETRQLKNFAAETGIEILIYTNTSKGKSITQLVNQSDPEDSNFSPASLALTDWLIMDGRALTALPTAQRQWLEDAVQAGLGLLVLADESLSVEFEKLSGNLLQGFSLLDDNDVDDEVIPQLASVTSFNNELALPVFPARLEAKSNQTPLDVLVTDQNGRPLVASQSVGLGKVAIGLISQSYRWVTSGQRTVWSNYWATISAALGRQRQNAILIPPADNEFFTKNQRATICAFADQKEVTVRITSSKQTDNGNPARDSTRRHSLELPLTADSLGSARKCGWYWPTTAGWEHIQLLSADSLQTLDSQSRYVWAQDQWPGQKRFERRNATSDRMLQQPRSGGQTELKKTVTEPLSVLWLWLLFITSASVLWLERKLDWDAPQNR